MDIAVGKDLDVLKRCAGIVDENEYFNFKFEDLSIIMNTNWIVRGDPVSCEISQVEADLFGYKFEFPAMRKLALYHEENDLRQFNLPTEVHISGITESTTNAIYVKNEFSNKTDKLQAARFPLHFEIINCMSTTDLFGTDTGISMKYSDGSSPPCTVVVVTCDQFTLPDQYVPVSAVYRISLTGAHSKPFGVKIQHCVDVKDENVSEQMSFALASHSSAEFQLIPGGEFPVGKRYGYIEWQDRVNFILTVKKQHDNIWNDCYYFCLYCWTSSVEMHIAVGRDLDTLKRRVSIKNAPHEENYFNFKFNKSLFLKMVLTLPEVITELENGWRVTSIPFPCQISKEDADLYGYKSKDPAQCRLEVCQDPTSNPPTAHLDYEIPVDGVNAIRSVIYVRRQIPYADQFLVAQVDNKIMDVNESNIASVVGSINRINDWMYLGLLLGLPSHKLVRISQDVHDKRERLQKMVSLWLDSGTASWRALVQALFDPPITEEELVGRIRKKLRCLESFSFSKQVQANPVLNVLKHISPTDPFTDTGLSMKYSDGSSPPCTVAVVTCDQFTLPDQYVPVSAVYKISLTDGAPSEPIRVKMQHCVDVKDDTFSKRMSFALASHSSTEFQLIPGGEFPVGERYGYIEREKFCCLLIVKEMIYDLIWPDEVQYFCLYYWESSRMHIAVSKDLNVLKRNACCSDEQNFPFKFIESSMMLDLKKRVTNVDNGWIIRTDPFPCQISKKDVDIYGWRTRDAPRCILEVDCSESPPTADLDYEIPIKGIESSRTALYVWKKRVYDTTASSSMKPEHSQSLIDVSNKGGSGRHVVSKPIDLQAVFRLLKPFSNNWNAIGCGLDVNFHFRDSLRTDLSHSTSESKLEAVLDKWVQSKCSEVSWDHLIYVLEVDVENCQLADDVKKYLDPR